MRLVKAASYVVRTPPHWGGYFWYFLRLETDTGCVGWGETRPVSMYGLRKASLSSSKTCSPAISTPATR
ncbi:MAG: hypothetical protein IPG56_12475 [Caulobacteraceae bacterium]|nr:hypothetical protein [Caulobacteraceae bacterium]